MHCKLLNDIFALCESESLIYNEIEDSRYLYADLQKRKRRSDGDVGIIQYIKINDGNIVESYKKLRSSILNRSSFLFCNDY